MKRKKVDYIIYESTCIRYERFNRRLIFLNIFLFIFMLIALVATNLSWVVYHSQYEVSETTITQDCERGNNTYICSEGAVNNAETDY